MDVEFLVLRDDVPTLLCMRDMVKNKLDISIKDSCLKFEGKIEPLIMRNYYLIYSWKPDDLRFALST